MKSIAATIRAAENRRAMKFPAACRTLALVLALGFAAPGSTETPAPAPDKDERAEREQVEHRVRPLLQTLFPDLELISLRHNALPGLLEAQLSSGMSVYLSPDGRNFLVGELYEIGEQGVVHVSEEGRMRWRKKVLAPVLERAISFTPQNRRTRAGVTVFTDVDCGYCRRIHQDVPDLNRSGIEVRYLAFPRAGIGSETYRKMVSAWCSDDQQRAMTRLKRGARVPTRLCAGNPVAEHYRLGQRLGVTGTPALLTDDGRMVPGYRPPEQMRQLLGLK